MRKAQFVTFVDKKNTQLLEDMELGPTGRFKKMFMLASMALFLSPEKKIKSFFDSKFIELKRTEV